MKEAGTRIREDWIVPCDFKMPEESGAAALDAIFSTSEPHPTAFVCANDEIARGVINAIRRWGKEVPLDVSITGFDNNRWTPYHHPALTSVSFPGREIGAAAATLLLERYKTPTLKARTVILPVNLVVRNSTMPLAAVRER